MRRRHRRATCRHCVRVRLLGLDFQAQRAAWLDACEDVAAGYATETREYAAAHRPPTFRDYLVAMAGTGWPMSGQAPRRTTWAA